MPSLRRHWIRVSDSARAAGPQNLPATMQGMRWQGTDTEDGELSRP
jgi:hypothetical protein